MFEEKQKLVADLEAYGASAEGGQPPKTAAADQAEEPAAEEPAAPAAEEAAAPAAAAEEELPQE